MRAVQVTAYGGPEVVKIVDLPEPVAKPGQVRVAVHATLINPADFGTRAGAFAERFPDLKPPFVMGWDLAGTVLEDAAGFAKGQHVIGLIPWFDAGVGAQAEIVVVEPEWIAPLPENVSFVDAAAAALNGLTAWQGLDNVGLDKGARLVVTGASGAVGGFAVQEAVRRGIEVTAIVSAEDGEYGRKLGALHVIERTDDVDLIKAIHELYPDGVDAVFDAAGAVKELIAAVRDGGIFNTVNSSQLPDVERNIQVGSTHVVPNANQLRQVGELLADGELETRVAQTVPLEQGVEADSLVSNGLKGKTVLTN